MENKKIGKHYYVRDPNGLLGLPPPKKKKKSNTIYDSGPYIYHPKGYY